MRHALLLAAVVVLGFSSVYGQLGSPALEKEGGLPSLAGESAKEFLRELPEVHDPVEIGLANLSYPDRYVVILYVKHYDRALGEFARTLGEFEGEFEGTDPLTWRRFGYAMDEYAIRNMDITIKFNYSASVWDYPIGVNFVYEGLVDDYGVRVGEFEYRFLEAVGGFMRHYNTEMMTANFDIPGGDLTDLTNLSYKISLIGQGVATGGDKPGVRTYYVDEFRDSPIGPGLVRTPYYPVLGYFVVESGGGGIGGELRMWIDEVRATSMTGRELNPVIKNAVLWGGNFTDCNMDGRLSAADALAALQMSVGEMEPNPNCDVDGDGRVTSSDAVELLRRAVEIERGG